MTFIFSNISKLPVSEKRKKFFSISTSLDSFLYHLYECLVQLSYQVVDGLIWLGIRDVINDFRKKKLMLRRLTYLSNSNSYHSDVPFGYIWSPHLVPKPKGLFPNILL